MIQSINFSLGILLFAVNYIRVNCQTSTNCNPLEKECPPNPGLGTSVFTDFTTGKSEYWTTLPGTTARYDATNGAQLTIHRATEAPTMVMNKYIMFGHVDMVARSSPGTGIVSSFVLLSQDLDEIDWEWLGGDNYHVQSNFFGKGDTSSYDRAVTLDCQTPIDTYHKYSIDWTAERIVWLIDDVPVRTVAFSDPVARGGKMYPQTPMEVKLGNWIGCLDMSNPQTLGTCQWAGGQTDLSKGPYTMSVKSINVTDYGCGGDYIYSDTSGSWQSIKSTGKCDGKGTGPGAPPIVPNAEGVKFPENPENSEPAASAASDAMIPLSFAAPHSNGSVNQVAQGTSNAIGSIQSITPQVDSGDAKDVNYKPPMTTSDAIGKPKHRYGKVDIFVFLFGLFLGYLVM